jgi:hypothetical protein
MAVVKGEYKKGMDWLGDRSVLIIMVLETHRGARLRRDAGFILCQSSHGAACDANSGGTRSSLGMWSACGSRNCLGSVFLYVSGAVISWLVAGGLLVVSEG